MFQTIVRNLVFNTLLFYTYRKVSYCKLSSTLFLISLRCLSNATILIFLTQRKFQFISKYIAIIKDRRGFHNKSTSRQIAFGQKDLVRFVFSSLLLPMHADAMSISKEMLQIFLFSVWLMIISSFWRLEGELIYFKCFGNNMLQKYEIFFLRKFSENVPTKFWQFN